MYVRFTDEEKEYIDKKPFNWTISEDCPDRLRESMERKLSRLAQSNDPKK